MAKRPAEEAPQEQQPSPFKKIKVEDVRATGGVVHINIIALTTFAIAANVMISLTTFVFPTTSSQ